jgi:hypothetical protein
VKNKNSSHSYSYLSGHIEDDIMQKYEQEQKLKNKIKAQDLFWQNKLLFWHLAFSHWAISTTWLHIEHRISNSCT